MTAYILFLFSKRTGKYRREKERNLERNLEEGDEAKKRTGMREKGKCGQQPKWSIKKENIDMIIKPYVCVSIGIQIN